MLYLYSTFLPQLNVGSKRFVKKKGPTHNNNNNNKLSEGFCFCCVCLVLVFYVLYQILFFDL